MEELGVLENIRTGSAGEADGTSEPLVQGKPGKKGKPSGKGNDAVDLRKLRRVDLLELLLDQMSDNEKLEADNRELNDLCERLKAKLDDKDAQIERLKTKLDQKDAQIELLESGVRELAEASGTISPLELEIEQRAIERYKKTLMARAAQNGGQEE